MTSADETCTVCRRPQTFGSRNQDGDVFVCAKCEADAKQLIEIQDTLWPASSAEGKPTGDAIAPRTEKVVEYGELASAVLYRDHRGNRWRYAIYDSVGVWDGWLLDLTLEAPFREATNALAAFVEEHWQQTLRDPWVADRPDWWSSGPAPM